MSVPRFITEKEVEIRKQISAAEGKVEEPYDPRSLYERLQIEKARKQEEWESTHALKNRIHRLDEDETKFLKKIAQDQLDSESAAEIEAEKLIKEAMNASKTLPIKDIGQRPRSRLPVLSNTSSSSFSQKQLLAGVIKKKLSLEESCTVDPSKSSESQKERPLKRRRQYSEGNDSNSDSEKKHDENASNEDTDSDEDDTNTNCYRKIFGYIPGIGCYNEDSDESDDSNSSLQPSDLDLLTPLALAHHNRTNETDGED